jgi:hypothetical protein
MLNKLQKTVYKATKKGTPFGMPFFNLLFILYFLIFFAKVDFNDICLSILRLKNTLDLRV